MVRYFYNTTKEHTATLDNFMLIAEKQETKILSYLKDHPYEIITSESIASIFPKNTPITSIRRAVCNLKGRGYLIITGKVKGEFNRNIFTYQYKEGGENEM